MSDLKRRFWVGSILIVCLSLILAWAEHPLLQYVAVASLAFFAMVALWEYQQFAKVKGSRVDTKALLCLGALEVCSFFAAAKSSLFRELPLYGLFLAFLVFFALHFRQKEGALLDLAMSVFGLLYIAVPFGMFLALLYDASLTGGEGRLWAVYLLVVTKMADVGAYFGGNLWGRRQLAPLISPKKTIEGAIAGLVAAMGASYLFALLSTVLSLPHFNLGQGRWLFIGLALGIIGQFGDLAESLLKRDANKKDSNALPGLGGALDAVDSLLFTLPILYFYLRAIQL